MTKAVKLPVVRIGQKPGLCGAACAQMILHSGGKVGKSNAIEDQLWDEIKANTTPGGNIVVPSPPPCGTFANQVTEACKPDALCWCTYPDALATTINDHLGPGGGVKVVRDNDATGLGLTARIVASVASGTAPAVLVHNATHWVVVYGFRAGGVASTLLVGSQNASHVYVHDPEWLATQTLYDIEGFTSEYLDAPVACGVFGGRQIMVGADTATPADLKVALPELKGPSIDRILEPTLVLKQAQTDTAALAATGEWSAALSHAQVRDPLLVADPTPAGKDYYLVDFRTGDHSTARMTYNARTGRLVGVSGITDTADYLPDAMLATDVPDMLTRRMGLDAASIRVDPTLTWKPCDQSHTRFQPFYVVHDGTSIVYVRVDGEVFTRLTRIGAGA